MKKASLITLLFILLLSSCKSEKQYSDYNEDDFYEVQGIITGVFRTSDPFDNPTVKNVRFTYFLDHPTPKTGMEENLDMFEAQNGYPLIVLVHKDDENISFYGRVGILDNVNSEEEKVLRAHLKGEMEKLRTAVPEPLYQKAIKTVEDN